MDAEAFVDMSFPLAGIDQSTAFSDTKPRQSPAGEWQKTAEEAMNVRGWEPGTDRCRGGSRPGLARYNASPVVADWIVQGLDLLVTRGAGSVQLNQAGRIVTLVAVSQGNVYTAQPGDVAWGSASNATSPLQTPPLIFSGVLYSTQANQKLYFADGTNYCYYDPATNQVLTWTATAGSLPADSRANTPRLICTWRGRVVLAGLLYDPQNWFMSKVGDPHNWDYAPTEAGIPVITPTQAVAGNNSPVGIVGDVITSLVPYNDDTLIFGGDHTLYQMSGDPMAGGQIDLISDSIGMAWGIPWAKDPYGNIYFVSNRCGIYTLKPGSQPVRISQQIEQLIRAYDLGQTTVRVLWNDRFQGLHVFMSPTLQPGTTTHFFWEARSGAWWTDQFADSNQDPLAVCVFDGNLPTDRVALIGSWDGYVRFFSPSATDDDGTPISSVVVIGPLTSKNLDEILIKDLQAVLGSNSGAVSYAVHIGATAEIALASSPITTGSWSAGRNLNTHIRWAGHALYVKLTSTVPWNMEVIRARVAGQGKVRRRGV